MFNEDEEDICGKCGEFNDDCECGDEEPDEDEFSEEDDDLLSLTG